MPQICAEGGRRLGKQSLRLFGWGGNTLCNKAHRLCKAQGVAGIMADHQNSAAVLACNFCQ